MKILRLFLPILMFLCLFVGSGLYFTIIGTPNAFYIIPPIVAILPAIFLAFCLQKESMNTAMNYFLDGLRHKDIITMCIIFLLAGAFNVVTKSIGCIDSVVNLILNFLPSKLMLIGVFLTSAIVSVAIGTSMGTIVTIGPIAVGIANYGAIPIDLSLATVVGGAMFGDSLSPISDTTIAAVMSQNADYKKKLVLNAKIACTSSVLMIFLLLFVHNCSVIPEFSDYRLWQIIPYLLLVILAFCGFNIFIVLISGIFSAFLLGVIFGNYSVIHFSKDLVSGFESMHEIFLLSLFVGGLGGLLKSQGAFDLIAKKIANIKKMNKKIAQLIIGLIVSVFDIFIPNNTVAIILSGDIVKSISIKYCIPKHTAAAWLDIFSCVMQGVLPYGAQILLASKLSGVSPILLSAQIYYCYIMLVITILYIICNKPKE